MNPDFAKIILIVEVIGDWLLFAGPLLQAAIELREEADGWDDVHKHLRQATRSDDWPKRVSFLWWLLPPVKVHLERKRSDRARSIISRELSDEELKMFRIFGLKARAWVIVSGGAWLMALATSYQVLCGEFHFSLIGWAVAIIFISFACLSSITAIFRNKFSYRK